MTTDMQTAILFKSLHTKISAAGVKIDDIELSFTDDAVAAYYIIASAEASSNLARFDGVRYGYRSDYFTSLDEMYIKTRSDGFGEEVRRRIFLGSYVLSKGYYDMYYRKAQQVRRLIRDELNRAFTEVDVLLMPTVSGPASSLDEKQDPLQMYISDRYTIPASLAGICAINIPYSANSASNPVGIQVLAPAFAEDHLFRVGRFIEECSESKSDAS